MDGLVSYHRHNKKIRQSNVSADLWISILEKCTIAAGIVGPLMVIPQILKIFTFHNATGVSALSWLAFGILDIPFIIYGAAHKDKPIVITYILWSIANFMFAAGAILYK